VDLTTALVSVGSAVIASGGFAAIARSLARRRTAPVEATKVLTDAAMVQVDQLQERVKEAEQEARQTRAELVEARHEAEETRQQMRAVRRECADLAEQMAKIVRWAQEPAMTIEQLRSRLPRTPYLNGTPT